MPRLHLRLLGGLEACLDQGPPIRLPTRKAEALLALLALPPGRARPREQLGDLLWGRCAEAQARNNLRQTLFLLRRSLPGFAGLRADGEALSLAPEAVEVDASTLALALQGGAAEEVQRAADLYAGELLAGFSLAEPGFQDWLRVERERLHRLALEAHARVLDHALGNGAGAAAIEIAHRLLCLDPLQEDVHRTLMQLYAESGKLGLAQRQYQACRDVLARELEVAPAAETEALRRSLLEPRAETGARAPIVTFRTKPALVRPELPVVAVLPLRTDDAETEALADRLSADVIAALAAWREFGVLSRGTMVAYDPRVTSTRRLTDDLAARYVVEGDLRRNGDRLRADLQVVDATTGRLLAAERIEHPRDPRWPTDDDLVRRIAATVATVVELAEQRLATLTTPGEPDAWHHYRRGMVRLGEHTLAGHAAARRLFEQALAIDPRFGPAWAMIGFSHVRDADAHFAESRQEAFERGFDLLRRALIFDEADWFPHAAISRALLRLGQFELAHDEASRAVDLNPASAMAHSLLGNVLAFMGMPEQGTAELRLGYELRAPGTLSGCAMVPALARAHLNARRYDAAVTWSKRALVVQTADWPWCHAIMAASLGHLGRPEQAEAALQKCEELHPGRVAKEFELPPTHYLDPADHLHILDGLRKAGFSG